jgi:Domain of unknown function (DUF4037)
MTAFVPGLRLSEQFYREIVRPILDSSFPGLAHAAGRIDGGSDVLGFDDETSMDHDWGPRLMLFLPEEEHACHSEKIKLVLANQLPREFRGFPTNFSTPDPDDGGTQVLMPIDGGPVNHRISIQTVRSFFSGYLGFDIEQTLEPVDWLTFPEQRLRTIATGAVFHDEVGLNAARAPFSYYPHDIWLYLLAAVWTRIGQEEHLMGRAGMVSDEIGSALIGARLVRDVMRLCFLMEKTYAPYPKWFGVAFKQLTCAGTLWPVLRDVLHSENWQARERNLVQAYEFIADRHNALQLTAPLPEKVKSFFGRPFKVIAQHGFAQALLKEIRDPGVKRIAERPVIGSLDLFSDNVDLVSDPSWRTKLRQLYG